MEAATLLSADPQKDTKLCQVIFPAQEKAEPLSSSILNSETWDFQHVSARVNIFQARVSAYQRITLAYSILEPLSSQ